MSLEANIIETLSRWNVQPDAELVQELASLCYQQCVDSVIRTPKVKSEIVVPNRKKRRRHKPGHGTKIRIDLDLNMGVPVPYRDPDATSDKDSEPVDLACREVLQYNDL
jgi:hypothetical protein